MKALNLILITSGKISEATAHIWVVSISGDNASRVYCKSPYKAMRYAFLLKKRTGLNISDNSSAMLAALGNVQASLTLLSLAQHLPLPRLPRDCTKQGSRHRPRGCTRSQAVRLCHSCHHTEAHQKRHRPTLVPQESQSLRLMSERKDRPNGRSFP